MKQLLCNSSGCSYCVIELHSSSLLTLLSEPAAYVKPHFHTVQVSPHTVTLVRESLQGAVTFLTLEFQLETQESSRAPL